MWIGPCRSLSRNCAKTSLVGSTWPMHLSRRYFDPALASARPKRDEIGTDHHRALDSCLGMIFFGKPLHTFPDHALVSRFRSSHSFSARTFANFGIEGH